MKCQTQITSRNASKSYMKMVDNSYLGSSDEVNLTSLVTPLIPLFWTPLFLTCSYIAAYETHTTC